MVETSVVLLWAPVHTNAKAVRSESLEAEKSEELEKEIGLYSDKPLYRCKTES